MVQRKVSSPVCTGLLSFFGTGVAGQVLTVFSIFNRFFGAAAGTGHAVGTMVFPYGPAVFQMDMGCIICHKFRASQLYHHHGRARGDLDRQ